MKYLISWTFLWNETKKSLGYEVLLPQKRDSASILWPFIRFKFYCRSFNCIQTNSVCQKHETKQKFKETINRFKVKTVRRNSGNKVAINRENRNRDSTVLFYSLFVKFVSGVRKTYSLIKINALQPSPESCTERGDEIFNGYRLTNTLSSHINLRLFNRSLEKKC